MTGPQEPPDRDGADGEGESDADGDGEGDTGANDRDGGPAGRDVEVPMRVYKAVTVFSTLFAVVFVLAGFVLLDVATQRATAPVDEIRMWFALLGLGAIGTGAAVYAFATRFRARGMGKPKDGADQPSDDG